jgi:hypothetical protein
MEIFWLKTLLHMKVLLSVNITITIMDIIHCPVFYSKHNVSETAFCLNLQVEPAQLGPIDRASFCLRTPATTPMEFIKPTQYKPPMRVNIFLPWISTLLGHNLYIHALLGPQNRLIFTVRNYFYFYLIQFSQLWDIFKKGNVNVI